VPEETDVDDEDVPATCTATPTATGFSRFMDQKTVYEIVRELHGLILLQLHLAFPLPLLALSVTSLSWTELIQR